MKYAYSSYSCPPTGIKKAMKSTITFDMSDPQDRAEHHVAVNGREYLFSLLDLDRYLSNRRKGCDSSTEDNIIEGVQRAFFNILAEYNITLEELP